MPKLKMLNRRIAKLVRRMAHTHETVGSNPAPAIKTVNEYCPGCGTITDHRVYTDGWVCCMTCTTHHEEAPPYGFVCQRPVFKKSDGKEFVKSGSVLLPNIAVRL